MPIDALDWYPWHWKEWRLSEAYACMTASERGIYRDLLDEQWANEAFVLDPARLARLCGISPLEFEEAWQTLKRWFVKRPDGRWNNLVMAKIRMEQNAKHTRMVERGRKGGRAAKDKRNKPTSSSSTSTSPSVPIEESRRLFNGITAESSEADQPMPDSSSKRIPSPFQR